MVSFPWNFFWPMRLACLRAPCNWTNLEKWLRSFFGPGVLVCASRGGGRSEAGHFFFFSLRLLLLTHFGESPVCENLSRPPGPPAVAWVFLFLLMRNPKTTQKIKSLLRTCQSKNNDSKGRFTFLLWREIKIQMRFESNIFLIQIFCKECIFCPIHTEDENMRWDKSSHSFYPVCQPRVREVTNLAHSHFAQHIPASSTTSTTMAVRLVRWKLILCFHYLEY